MSADLDVAVVGAGAAGLAAAHALTRAGRSVRVFEAADAVGGRMRTLRRDGYTIDTGAEMIATAGYTATWRLIREAGLSSAEVPRVPDPVAVWRGGRAHPHVGRPLGLLTGAGLSARGRLDLLRLTMAARWRRPDPDDPAGTHLGAATVAQLAERYTPDLTESLIRPMTSGFFGWRAERSAAGPFVAHLAATGSTAGWRTYRDGMDTLARWLAGRLDVTTGLPVRSVIPMGGPGAGGGTSRVCLDCGGRTLTARAVVLAVPAPVAARLHPTVPDDERAYLRACTYAPMLRVSLALDRPLAPAPGRGGFATLVPASEDAVINVLTVDHRKHPARAPVGRGLVSLVTAPPATRELLDRPDAEVVALLTQCAERYLPGLASAVRAAFVHRFRDGLPEATPEAVRGNRAFRTRPPGPIEYAGDWVLQRPCSEGALRSGLLAATRVLEHTPSAPPVRPAAGAGRATA